MQFVFDWAMIRNIAPSISNVHGSAKDKLQIKDLWRNLFGPKSKVPYHEKLVLKSGVRFLFLFVLTDAILLKLDLQKRTSVLGNPPNEKLFVYKKWSTYQKIGDVLFFSYIKATIGQCELVQMEAFYYLKVSLHYHAANVANLSPKDI